MSCTSGQSALGSNLAVAVAVAVVAVGVGSIHLRSCTDPRRRSVLVAGKVLPTSYCSSVRQAAGVRLGVEGIHNQVHYLAISGAVPVGAADLAGLDRVQGVVHSAAGAVGPVALAAEPHQTLDLAHYTRSPAVLAGIRRGLAWYVEYVTTVYEGFARGYS